MLDGRDLPVDAVKAEGHADWAHHITLENLLIRVRGHGNNQQTVGISTKCPAWGWVIRDNEIIGAGPVSIWAIRMAVPRLSRA